ncbi:FimV family protein [Psychrobacter sp. 72-O-c]|uniref:type IV pilus assembly protein FimV n=1 Tax=Psychrobacter sp. 72-O-c TaxID=2774125 RepID=UPI00191B65CE|nr:peptigoglycan-binding protein LysM [Psychrobacter sp. 72-O-c]
MSWHLPHRFYRLTTIHRGVSMALFCSASSVAMSVVMSSGAQAATMGKTIITSAQHEPLAASIIVTDIRAADFSAALANSVVYQQMGLTPTASMTVRFKPISSTAGQLFISTSQPVSKPFADVVLAINEGGQRKVIPKTLLMPLDDSLPIKPSNTVITTAKKPNLPVVSTTNAQPLTVRKGTPPPLLSSPRIQPPTQALNLPTALMPMSMPQMGNLVNAPSSGSNDGSKSTILNNSSILTAVTSSNASVSTSNSASPANAESIKATNSEASDNIVSSNLATNKTASNKTLLTNTNTTTSNNNTPTTGITDKQLDILNIQVTRQIQPTNTLKPKTPNPNTNTNTNTNTNVLAAQPAAATSTPTDNKTTPTAELNTDNSNVPPSSDTINTNSMAQQTVSPKVIVSASANIPTNSMSGSAINYTVQRNDNLWVISQQIAERNNLDIQTVMTQIQSQNPDAFIDQDANQLKANTRLNLSNYDVIPSQQSLQAAISAQRQYTQRVSKPVIETTAQPKLAPKTSSETTQASNQATTTKSPEKPVNTTTQTLPKARFSVLAPARDGNADGAQTKAAAATGNGLSTDILATLKSSRKRTAVQASRLLKTNSTLGSYTRKLQLQNQKLAELQARLKKLRNQ